MNMKGRIKTTVDDGIFVGISDDDGAPRPRCSCSETVCLETPTHLIAPPGAKRDPTQKAFYCERHYVLSLAHLIEVHVPNCAAPLSEHLGEFGEL